MTTEIKDSAEKIARLLKALCDEVGKDTGRFTHSALHLFDIEVDGGHIVDESFMTTFEVEDPIQLLPTHDAVVQAMQNYKERVNVYTTGH